MDIATGTIHCRRKRQEQKRLLLKTSRSRSLCLKTIDEKKRFAGSCPIAEGCSSQPKVVANPTINVIAQDSSNRHNVHRGIPNNAYRRSRRNSRCNSLGAAPAMALHYSRHSPDGFLECG